MKGKGYSEEFKEQVLREVERTGNMNIVAWNHNIPSTTINTWIRKKKNAPKGSSPECPKSCNFNSSNYNKELEKENDLLKKEPSINDRYQVAKYYIEQGYKVVLVLKYASLNHSTYYYRVSIENKVKKKPENVGRPIVEFSLTTNGKIDVFHRSIIDYYMGYSCTGSDASGLIRRCLIRRNLLGSEIKPVIRTDNGAKFISNIFEESCAEVNIYHERIPSRTPNKNAHIESFHRIFDDECIGVYEFDSYKNASIEVSRFMNRYNTNRLHSSLKYITPNEFYTQNLGKEVENMAIHL